MEKLMANMKAAGLGGMSMYNREDMEDMMENGEMDDYGDFGGGMGSDASAEL